MWAEHVKDKPLEIWIEQELPPLDVLMVWHTYLLNPTWYAEDCSRLPIMKTLGDMKGRLLAAIVS